MDTITTEIPTVAGTPFAGGFYAGRLLVAGVAYALIVAPRGEGEHEPICWSESDLAIPTGERSFYDGFANTEAMAGAENALAKWARGLRIGGFADWYLPSRDELEILYRAFKPTAEENYCWRGDNPSSIPVGYAYRREEPAQTAVEIFRDGKDEAFEDTWYWSSTQDAGNEAYAWGQYFDYGDQYDHHKDLELRARAVRRLKI
jgi:hypothetical protein